jgi:VCBS repeat-containing protein
VTGIDDDITAVNDTDAVDEDGTISRAAGSSYDVDSDDTDLDDSSSSSITAIRIGASEGNGVSGTVGSALTGTYGTLTLNADGSYTYVADQAAADALDAGDTVTDSFNYTVTSGSQTDTATLVFTVTGINDPVVAVNDTDAVTEDATISRSVGDDQELDGDDTDSDASSSSTITNIRTGATEGSGTEGTIGSGLVGTYGTLTVNADGSYTYVADQQASDELGAGVSATDSFNYTVSDGTSTDTATLVITVTGTDPKNNPIAADDTGSVIEGNTLTVSDGDSDLIAANDTDADTATSSLTISGIRTGSESGTGTTGTVGTALVGTYGTLTVNANGSYTYVANTDSAKEIAPGSSEVDKFTYTLTDGVDTDTAQISFTVTGINNPPTVTPIGVVSVLETQKIKLDTTTFFNDPDPSINNYGQLVYSTTGLPSQLSLDEDTGLITGTFGVDEYGTYTFTITGTDGGNLSTQTTVTIHVRKPTPEIDDNVKVNKKTGEFKKVKIKAKNIEKLNLRAEARVQNFSSNYSAPEIVRDLSFSGGLKVVDVGAEVMNTKLVPNQEGVTVGFSIADDYKQNVKQYTGVMKDGSALPDWIKVDPNNGQTLTQFPEGIEAIEIKIIAIEKDNTARNINVVLDKAKIEADPFLQKDLDKFFDRSATLKTLVEVDNQGQVNLQRQTDNEIDQTLTSNLNTPLNDSMRTPDVFFQEGFEPQSTFKISNMENTTTGYKIDIIDDSRDTVKQYSASFANGTPLPQWISINPISGLIEANPPSGIEKISFKVLAEDDDGDTRVLDVELDFTSNDELSSLIPQDQESIQSISPLSDQLFSEYNKYENYGSKLIDRINA